MTRLTISCISCLIVSLMCVGQSNAEIASDTILGIWLLDEGAGDIAEDASGNGHDGTLMVAPNWVAGHFGNALDFSGSSSYVDCGNAEALNVEVFSVSFWCYIPSTQGWNHMISRGEHHGGGNPGAVNWGIMMYDGQETILYETYNDTVKPSISVNTTAGEWHHVVATHDGTTMELYHDGQSAGTSSTTGILLDENLPFIIGAQSRASGPSDYFDGSLDDVGYFHTVLAPEDIEEIMNNGLAGITGGIPVATRPQPADGALHEDTWVTLSWKPGDFAVSHDVYLGDNFNDVEQAAPDSDVFRGNQVTDFYIAGFPGFAYPDGLVPGTTYYWRIDEVNDTDPNSPWKGDIWSLSIPSKTAYNPLPADGTGLANTTVTLKWTPGFGAKLHTVYLGDDYDQVNNDTVGVPTGAASYSPGQLEREKVYYWRVDEFDGVETYKGDVWGFSTPGAVESPQPSNGATGEPKTAQLAWTPAANAISHDVYFGADKDTVKNATTASPEYMGNKALGSESHDPGLLTLGTTYYWRVDAVYNSGTVKGLVWSFTIADFITVEDFESYNDIDPPDPNSNRIFDSWIDGFGTTDNGALVGNDLPPYAEQTIVHGGAQSMIYRYDNNLKTSEATLTLVYPRDWTAEGVMKLSLWFRGASGNAADRMYVSLNGTAVVYHDEPTATLKTGWNEWIIDLQAFQGVNFTNVNTITIGIGTKGSPAAGGIGAMYFDDIRLIR